MPPITRQARLDWDALRSWGGVQIEACLKGESSGHGDVSASLGCEGLRGILTLHSVLFSCPPSGSGSPSGGPVSPLGWGRPWRPPPRLWVPLWGPVGGVGAALGASSLSPPWRPPPGFGVAAGIISIAIRFDVCLNSRHFLGHRLKCHFVLYRSCLCVSCKSSYTPESY